MPFSPEEIATMGEALGTWRERSQEVSTALLIYPYRCPRAREMAENGACRRLMDLDHCLMRVFEVLPPDLEAPDRVSIFDATMFLQAFVINVYGAIDNLAWIWTYEKPVLNTQGNALPNAWVGFKRKHTHLRQSVSDETRAFLEGADAWFDFLEVFRDALAHRIPLYIPPFTMTEEAIRECNAFHAEVMAEGWSLENHNRVMARTREMGRFEPLMAHSVLARDRVLFHPQMINDLSTVITLAELVLSDLNGLRE